MRKVIEFNQTRNTPLNFININKMKHFHSYKFVLLSIFILLLNLFNVNKLKSQTSYIFPDIAAPGMVTYFEIIAKANDLSFFGPDGFSLNNPTSNVKIRIAQQQPQNIDIASFGPISVSWQGRVLSSYIFVNPDVQPADWDWEKSGMYVIIEVLNGANKVGEYRIDIVRPFPFGDKSGVAENVLGQGQLGKRSRRGAMIVDSMILGNQVYSVSKVDTDLSLAGNQGYLPFTLISKGPIRGTGATSEINVNASTLNGGVGGGGGAGAFCDVQFGASNTGTEGGDGFTGGGPGGQNGTVGSVNQKKASGNGSGAKIAGPLWGGSSINGIVGGTSTTAHESSGGGTGHPFGLSGDGCSDGGGCNPLGGNGAGSGYRQLSVGGSAGYATDGLGSGGVSQTGGKMYGNAVGVPLAGGSGGGGGNPQGISFCAGYGGGGGGAIRVQAENVLNVRIKANGANGGNATLITANGGAGSGGFIDFHTKLGFANVAVEANSGVNGGLGRVRFNTFTNTSNYPVIVNSSAGSTYFGFGIDTTTYLSETNTKIYGSVSSQIYSNNKLTLYLKHGKNGDWNAIGKPTIYDPNTGKWEFNLDISAYKAAITSTNKYFYIAAGVEIDNPSTTPYRYEPRVVFSQSGANVLIADLQPEIKTQTRAPKKVFACGNSLVTDSLWITNIGEGLLEVDLVNDWVQNNQGFSLIAPVGKQNLDAGDSVYVKFSFDPTGKTSGIYRDSLKLFTNIPGNNGLRYLLVELDLDKYAIEANDFSNNKIDTIDMGVVCIGKVADARFKLKNLTSSQINVNRYEFSTNFSTDFELTDAVIGIININDSKELEVINSNTSTITHPNPIIGLVRFFIPNCPESIDSVYIKLVVSDTKLEIVDAADLDFGDVIVGKSKTNTIRVRNNGPQEAQIDANLTFIAPFNLITTRPALPTRLKAGDILEIDLEFTPTLPSIFTQNKNIQTISDGFGTNLSCNTDIDFIVRGVGINSNFEYPSEIDFGYVFACKDNKDSTFKIKNKNNKVIKFANIINIEGNDPTLFEVSYDPINLNKEYGLDEELEFKVTFKSKDEPAGFKSALAKIDLLFTEDNSTETISIGLKGHVERLETSISPNNVINFGDIPVNINSGPQKVTIKNIGKLTRTYTYINSPEVTVVPATFTLLPDEEQILDIYVKIDKEGNFTTNIQIEEEACKSFFTLLILGNAIKSEVRIEPLVLDFGVKSPCMTEDLFVDVINDGKIDVTFVRAEITGTNSNFFSILNVVNNVNLSADGGNLRQNIRFSNPTKSKGIFNADLKLTILENGVEITYNIPINVNVTSGFEVTPIINNIIELDFGDVVVNQTSTKQFTFKATEYWRIVINNINPSLPNEIKVNTQNLIDADLSGGNTYNWDVTYTPSAVGPINGQIRVFYKINNDDNCLEDVLLLIKGNGKPAAKVSISVEDMTIDPTNDNLKIPVKIRITEGLENINSMKIDTLAISYNYTQFYPNSVENGSILNSEISNIATNTATTYITSNLFNLDTIERNVVSLVGSAMLGNIQKSDLKIEKSIFNQENLIGEKIIKNGSLNTIICEDGDNPRLLTNSTPMKLSVNVNNNILTLNCEVIELGNHKVEIYNLNGELIKSNQFEHTLSNNSNNRIYDFTFNIDDFANGMYIVRFSSQNRSKISKITIIK